MDRSGYTPDHDDEMDEDQPAEDASLAGRGWDILVGGEANAAALGGEDPFDEDPRDTATEDIIRMGREGRGRPITYTSADEPPRDLSPEELGTEMVKPAGEHTALHPTPEESDLPETLSGERFPPEPVTASTEPEPPAEVVPEPAPAMPEPAFALPEDEDEGEADVLPEPEPEPELPTSTEPFERSGEAPFGAAPSPPRPGAPPAEEEPEAASPLTEEPLVVAPQALIDARPHDPFEEEEPLMSAAGPEELPPDPKLGTMLITQPRIDALWNEINETYNIVVSDVRGHYRSTDTAIKDLKRARELLVAGTEHFDNAEELVKRVKSRLRLEEKVRQWSRTHGTWIAIYLVAWLLLLFIGSLLVQRIDAALAAFVPRWMADTFLPAMYGGLGGVIGALWVLINHIAKKRDFDPIHTPWYITNPFMGIALGVVTYFVLRATSLAFNTEVVAVDGGNRLGLYLACIIVGFNQNVLWALIDRVIEAIIPQQETTATVDEESTPNESNR